jgi:hypothetical protein
MESGVPENDSRPLPRKARASPPPIWPVAGVLVPAAGAWIVPADLPIARRQAQPARRLRLGGVGRFRRARVGVLQIDDDGFLARDDLDGVAVVAAHGVVGVPCRPASARYRRRSGGCGRSRLPHLSERRPGERPDNLGPPAACHHRVRRSASPRRSHGRRTADWPTSTGGRNSADGLGGR